MKKLKFLKFIFLIFSSVAFGQGGVVGKSGVIGGSGVFGASTIAAFTFVGQASANCHTVTTCAITYSPTSGNLIIVDMFVMDTTAAQSPTLTTDNSSSTYANEFASGQDPTGNFYFNEDASLAISSGVTTITTHLGAATTSSVVIVTEYHRASGSWVFSSVSTLGRVTTGSTSQTCPTSTTPTASVQAVINANFYTATGQDPFLSSGSYTLRKTAADIFSGDEAGVLSNIVASTSGSYSGQATNGTSVTYECWTSAYK